MVHLGRALRHRNFRLFFIGQGVSVIGSILTNFATVWMVYRLTHSGLLLGLCAFFGQVPTALISPLAGVLVDRWDRHRVIIATQIAAMLQSAALAFFALTGLMTVWHLIVLAAVQAVINGFDVPARQSFLRELIDDRADLPNAIALNSTMFNSARMIGPLVAAVLVSWLGEGYCFTIDAFSYLAVVASLFAVRVAKRPPRERRHVWIQMKEGWHYVVGHSLVRAVLLLISVTSLFGGAYGVLLPLIARAANNLGILMACSGCGALCGALYLASRRTVVGIDMVVARAVICLGSGMIALRFVPVVWLATPLIFAMGGALMIQMASTNTILQTVVDPDRIGRVMSLYTMAVFTAVPLGALLLGTLADRIGVFDTFSGGGAVTVVAGLVFMRALPKIRRVAPLTDHRRIAA